MGDHAMGSDNAGGSAGQVPVRCPWALGDPLLTTYHDEEWGRPVHGERRLFERLVLEGFQAGLSWLIVLRKRPAFRRAFLDFDPDAVAGLTDDELEALAVDPAIIRNRAKIDATRSNARAVVALRDDGGLDRLVWSHRPEPGPAPTSEADVPTRSPESTALAAALRARGLRFIGPTSAYALMQATGMVDDHVASCHRRGVASDP